MVFRVCLQLYAQASLLAMFGLRGVQRLNPGLSGLWPLWFKEHSDSTVKVHFVALLYTLMHCHPQVPTLLVSSVSLSLPLGNQRPGFVFNLLCSLTVSMPHKKEFV